MKPSIKVSWKDPKYGPNQAIFNDWFELLEFLCLNKNTKGKLNVSIFEQECQECAKYYICNVAEA